MSSDWDQFLVVNLGLDCMVILGQYEIKRFEFYEFFQFFGFLVDSETLIEMIIYENPTVKRKGVLFLSFNYFMHLLNFRK